MPKINKTSFFIYFLNETGGLYDPAFVTLVIEKLKEWLPESTEEEEGFSYGERYDELRFLHDELQKLFDTGVR